MRDLHPVQKEYFIVRPTSKVETANFGQTVYLGFSFWFFVVMAKKYKLYYETGCKSWKSVLLEKTSL